MKDTAIINTLSPLTYLYKQGFFSPSEDYINTNNTNGIDSERLAHSRSKYELMDQPGGGGWGMLSYLIELFYLETVFGTDRTFVTNMLCQKHTNRLVSIYSVRID